MTISLSVKTPFGQISNHYENEYWDEFHCEEREVADKWDGHNESDVLDRLQKCNLKYEKNIQIFQSIVEIHTLRK